MFVGVRDDFTKHGYMPDLTLFDANGIIVKLKTCMVADSHDVSNSRMKSLRDLFQPLAYLSHLQWIQ